jgi:thymidine phosphorylase
MVAVGENMGVRTSAILSDMNQPHGRAVGNALEVREAIAVLQGAGPADVRDVTFALGAELLLAVGAARSRDEALRIQELHIESGRAWEKFGEMVAAQGGDAEAELRVAPRHTWHAPREGRVEIVDAEQFGWAVIELGGGRHVQGEAIDHSVGLECLVETGDRVDAGQPLVNVFADADGFARVTPLLERAAQVL